MKVVREIVSGEITINEVVEKYNLGCNKTVQHWLEKYSCEIGVYTSQDMGTRKKKDLTDVEKQKIDLEKALKDANLKIMALETLINVAEKELKIDIRKKPGTKQS
jgi:transposase-like protein